MSTLAEIEAAIPKLNARELADLERLVQAERRKAERGSGSSILNFTPASVGRILKPISPDDDVLGEMLETDGLTREDIDEINLFSRLIALRNARRS